MKILNININDFGGPENHREDFKNKLGNGKYIQEWDKLDKKETINSFISKLMNTNLILLSYKNMI